MIGDPTLALFQKIFGELIDPEVWQALAADERPVEEIIDGPFSELIDEMFAALTSPAIMKFAPGLRPTLTSDLTSG